MNDLEDYAWLIGQEARRFLRELAEDQRPLLQRQSALRKHLSAERARLISEQVELRKRAKEKFGKLAAELFFTPVQLEQATDLWIARYKAERFAQDRGVADYCCGLGGDLLALAQRCRTIGWERDPAVALLAEANLQCVTGDGVSRVERGEVAEQLPSGPWHVDPDRRSEQGRSTQVELHSPPPEAIERWLAAQPEGAVKLAPATTAPENWQKAGELEWISRGRECRQLVAWFGGLTSCAGKRRATCVSIDPAERLTTATFLGNAGETAQATDRVGRYVYDADPSLVASHLLGALANEYKMESLGAGAIFLTSDAAIEAPLLQRFEVCDCLPLRSAAVAKHLEATGVGRVEIKIRGVEVDPQKFRKSLQLRGDDERTLLLTRIERRQVAIVAKRCGKQHLPCET